MVWLDSILLLSAFFVSVPLLIVSIELFIVMLLKDKKGKVDSELKREAYTILMPAHNEELLIGKTLSRLIKQGIVAHDIVVVADNCSDNTAELAKTHGVTLIERFDDVHRGKGYALDFGVQYINEQGANPCVIILDADCEIERSALEHLAARCKLEQRPIQALYLMRISKTASIKQRIAGFAWLVKNKLRPKVMEVLGLPVTLTGTGMALPFFLLKQLNFGHGNIVEDMQLGIDCTLSGAAPKFCEKAVVYSDFPEQEEAEKTQRTRWEHGHLMTIAQQVPMLCKQAILRKDWRLLALALDIGVPPLSLLVLTSVAMLTLLAIYAYAMDSYASFSWLLVSFLFFSMMLMTTWWKSGQDYLTIKELSSIPHYVFSKITVYISFVFNRQKSWVKTSRDNKK